MSDTVRAPRRVGAPLFAMVLVLVSAIGAVAIGAAAFASGPLGLARLTSAGSPDHVGPRGAGGVVVLHADFDDKAIDQPIGLGGAAVGEPVSVPRPRMEATVREQVFPSPSLELSDFPDCCGLLMRFEFLDDAVITSGVVEIRMRIRFDSLRHYAVYVNDVTQARIYVDLRFRSDGTLAYADEDDPGKQQEIPGVSYLPNTDYDLVLEFDLDGGTYDVRLGPQVVLDDEAHGVVSSGIWAVYFGHGLPNGTASGLIHLDDLTVTASDGPSAITGESWARTKMRYRD